MSKRRHPATSKRVADVKFWGPDEPPVPEPVAIAPTPDPAAVIRSLGAPPLAVDASMAERHLTAVYEEAVRAATALAAANGLLAPRD